MCLILRGFTGPRKCEKSLAYCLIQKSTAGHIESSLVPAPVLLFRSLPLLPLFSTCSFHRLSFSVRFYQCDSVGGLQDFQTLKNVSSYTKTLPVSSPTSYQPPAPRPGSNFRESYIIYMLVLHPLQSVPRHQLASRHRDTQQYQQQ